MGGINIGTTGGYNTAGRTAGGDSAEYARRGYTANCGYTTGWGHITSRGNCCDGPDAGACAAN